MHVITPTLCKIGNVDFTDADVVIVYLTTSGNEKLESKFEHELRTGTRVISHDFEFPGWKPSRVEKTKENMPQNTQSGYTRFKDEKTSVLINCLNDFCNEPFCLNYSSLQLHQSFF